VAAAAEQWQQRYGYCCRPWRSLWEQELQQQLEVLSAGLVVGMLMSYVSCVDWVTLCIP
jgi:hypothetical protein